jgi:hypothetical protein
VLENVISSNECYITKELKLPRTGTQLGMGDFAKNECARANIVATEDKFSRDGMFAFTAAGDFVRQVAWKACLPSLWQVML